MGPHSQLITQGYGSRPAQNRIMTIGYGSMALKVVREVIRLFGHLHQVVNLEGIWRR